MDDLLKILYAAAKDAAHQEEEMLWDKNHSALSDSLRQKCPELVGPFDAFAQHGANLYEEAQWRQFAAGFRCGAALMADLLRPDTPKQ